MDPSEFRNTILVDIAWSARKHGVADEDIQHAVRNAMTMVKQLHDRCIYLGPGRDARLLEVITLVREGRRDLAIHAMPLRRKYNDLLAPGP